MDNTLQVALSVQQMIEAFDSKESQEDREAATLPLRSDFALTS